MTEGEVLVRSRDNRSGLVFGAAVVFVVGLACSVGVSSSQISFFALRSFVRPGTSLAPVTSTTGSVVPNAAASTRRTSDTLKSTPLEPQLDGEAMDTAVAGRGFGLPLVLAGLSMVLLGMASWLVRPRRQEAMAFASGFRDTALHAAEDGAVATPELKITGNVEAMLTPLGYYEAYELVVVVSPRLSDLEKEDRLSTLEVLFPQNKCKKVEKVDRGRRLLAYPIKGSIEAYIVLYTFKGPRTMPKIINDWFVGPGINSDGNVFRCFLTKQKRVKKGAAVSAEGEEDVPMWNV